MPFFWTIVYGQLLLFTMILARVGALIMTAPIFGSQSVPARVRIFLAVSLSILITTLQFGNASGMGNNLLDFSWRLGAEVFVGLLLGMGITILFSGIQVAGQIISQLSGMALADVYSPGQNGTVPLFSLMMYQVSMAVFVIIGGHRMVMQALLDTFVWAPPGRGIVADTYVDALVNILSQSFVLGIRAAAPIMAALLLSTLILGLIGRTMPQINILLVGFGINSALTLAGLFITIGLIAWTFQEQTLETLEMLQGTIFSESSQPLNPGE